MIRTVLVQGAVAGVIVGVPLFGMTVAMQGQPPLTYGLLLGYLIMLVALSTVFVAIKRRRDRDLGGIIGFWPAFGMGLGISAIAGILYVVAWEAALAVTHLDFAGEYAKMLIADQQARGVTGDALRKVTGDMDRFKEQYANLYYRIPMTFAEIFPVGVLVSLVSAGLLRNSGFLPHRRG